MGDIFDDADKILTDSLEDDKNFNESELQDIMSEIEDLEKEFETESTTTLQEEIDAELEMELAESAVEIAVTPEAEVLAFEKAPAAIISSPTKPSVSFAAEGQMSLNLDFKVGTETAKLFIDPVKGLIVTLSGVELCINEDTGCTVSMENGTKFTIPLSSQDKSLKKKAV